MKRSITCIQLLISRTNSYHLRYFWFVVYKCFQPLAQAFKTNSYSRQPPPAPERTPLSREVQLYEKYDQGVEGLFERPAQSFDRPRSRRSTDAARKYSPTKQEIVALPNLSPRRTKNTLYEDSEEVSSKRREASKERQKEYNDFLKVKVGQSV